MRAQAPAADPGLRHLESAERNLLPDSIAALATSSEEPCNRASARWQRESWKTQVAATRDGDDGGIRPLDVHGSGHGAADWPAQEVEPVPGEIEPLVR